MDSCYGFNGFNGFNIGKTSACQTSNLNTKPLGAQRIRYLMNLTGYCQSEDQTRVGEREKKVYEEKKNFAGKVSKMRRCL